jgi:hypothetical protein
MGKGTCIKLKGLPYSAGTDDVLCFFRERGYEAERARIVLRSDGITHSGMAYALLRGDSRIAHRAAADLNGAYLGHRWIKLVNVPLHEMNEPHTNQRTSDRKQQQSPQPSTSLSSDSAEASSPEQPVRAFPPSPDDEQILHFENLPMSEGDSPSPPSDMSTADGSTATSDDAVYGFEAPSVFAASAGAGFGSFFSSASSAMNECGSSNFAQSSPASPPAFEGGQPHHGISNTGSRDENFPWSGAAWPQQVAQPSPNPCTPSYSEAAKIPPPPLQSHACASKGAACKEDRTMSSESNKESQPCMSELPRDRTSHTHGRNSIHQTKTGKNRKSVGNNKRSSQTPTLRVRGLPFRASKEEVESFFAGFGLVENTLQFGYNEEGLPSGEAWLDFVSKDEARRAKTVLQHAYLKHRWLELAMHA